MEGYPSAIDKTANTFTGNGQLASYTETAFERGSNEATLSSGRFIEVEGILTRGVLIAENISIELEDEHEAKGGSINDTFTVSLTEKHDDRRARQVW